MSRRHFEATPFPGGPPRYQIRCPCGETDSLTRQNLGAEAAQEQVPQKFTARGWDVGQRPDGTNDRCPACRTAEAAARRAKRRPSHPQDTPTMALPTSLPGHQPKAEPTTRPTPPTTGSGVKPAPPVAEPPRAMEREDRRLIHNKLEEVYLDEAKGYTADWSDERVAKDLGVPRAWVAEMRDLNFGPALTPEATKALAEIAALRADLTERIAANAREKQHLAGLSARLDAVERATKPGAPRA